MDKVVHDDGLEECLALITETKEEILIKFLEVIQNQEQLKPEIIKMVDEFFWELI